jgi:hypothetical protein
MASDRGVKRNHGDRIVVGWVLVEALVRTVVVEVPCKFVEDGKGMSLVVDQQLVGALFADAANEPFRVAVRPGCPGRDLDHVESFGGEHGIEGGSELGVPVADQEAKGSDPLTEVHQEVASGLGGPGCGRMSSHAQDVNPAGAYFHDEQDIESAQRDGVEGEEVCGQQPGGLCMQKGPPPGVCSAWGGAEAGGGENPADRTRAQVVSEPDEFALDAAVAPGRILLCQAQHHVPDLVTDRWAAWPVGIGPLFPDQAPVPGQQGRWSDDPMQMQVVGSRRVRAARIARSGQWGRGRLT